MLMCVLGLSHSTHLTFEADQDQKVFAHLQMYALFVLNLFKLT